MIWFLMTTHIALVKAIDQEQKQVIIDVSPRPFHLKWNVSVPSKDIVLLAYNFKKKE